MKVVPAFPIVGSAGNGLGSRSDTALYVKGGVPGVVVWANRLIETHTSAVKDPVRVKQFICILSFRACDSFRNVGGPLESAIKGNKS